MSEENNNYGNNGFDNMPKDDDRYHTPDNGNVQYTQVPETEYTDNGYYNGNMNGTPNAGGTNDYTSGKGQGIGLGIAAMVCGIVSLIGCCGFWFISIPCAIAAIILGIVQIVKNQSKGMAIAGIVCGALGIIISVLLIIFSLAVVSNVTSEEYQDLMHDILEEYGGLDEYEIMDEINGL